MAKKRKIDKILCPTCGTETNHEIVWEAKKKEWGDEDAGIWATTDFDVLQCLGCETPTLRKKYIFSEDMDIRSINGENVVFPDITLWPKTGYRLLKPKYISNAPPNVKRIYRETIEAYNSELPTLCAAGVRAVIECICKEEEIIKDDLKEKIGALKEKRIITDSFAEGLHENRLLGNDALHESTLFGDVELKTAIELIETLIEMVYETKQKANLLKNIRESKSKKEKVKI